MNRLATGLVCLSLFIAGLVGITLSLPLQAPALILLGMAALVSTVFVFRANCESNTYFVVLLAVVYFVIRAVYSPVWDLAVEDLILIIAAAILYMLAGPILGRPNTRTALAITVIALLLLHVVSAIIQITGREGFSMIWYFTDARRSEGNVVTGMYGYRGSFANFTIIAGMLSLCLGIWGRFPKWLRVALSILGMTALVLASLAHSRSAMISLGLGGLVFLVMIWISVESQKNKLRSRFRSLILILGCLGVLLGCVGTAMVFKNRAQHTADGADILFDSDVRLAFWPMAIEQFVDHPVTGAGSRSFSYECFYYWSPNMDTGEANPEFVHNEYLQLLADYGLVGFLLAVGLLFFHFVIGVKRVCSFSGRIGTDGFNKGSNAMALAIAGTVGIVVMAVHVVFDFRTHLMANLLILVCCLVWVLPAVRPLDRSKKERQRGIRPLVLILSLLVLGSWGMFIGIVQLRGGAPLLHNRMATEAGTWFPESVSRDVWIPALEKSIEMTPSYRRHLKLGTLYRLEATNLKGSDRLEMMRKAIGQYEKAAVRHPYEPVSRLNLASLHTFLAEYEIADSYFENTDRLGSSRERWFRIHTKWADMHRQWAGSLWRAGETGKAGEHYQKALAVLKDAEVKSGDNTEMYLMVIIEYARMLDSQNKYEATDGLFDKAEKGLPPYVINSLKKGVRREMGEHYLRKAKYLWYKREPEEAYKVLLKAKRNYYIHQVVLKGREDAQWKKGYDEVKGILKFFKETGVGN